MQDMELDISYAIFRIKPLLGHFDKRLALHDKCTAPLDHRNLISMLVIVLSDIVARIATTYDDGLLAFYIKLWASELR